MKCSPLQMVLWMALFSIGLGSCDPPSTIDNKPTMLTVAVAANVQFAMEELAAAFEQQYQFPVHLVVGSSGKLTAQIRQGAPYDLLVSANMKYPNALFRDSLTGSEPDVYALGTLIWWTMKPLALDSVSSLLPSDQIRKIAIANPKNAPYGEETIHLLEKLGLLKPIKSKLVYGESIAQTNQYIIAAVCDIGVTAKSIVMSPEWQDKGTWQAVDEHLYEPIQQGVVVTKGGALRHPVRAQQFQDFLFSASGKSILRRYGYLVD